MKRNAIAKMIKDIVFAAIAWGIFTLILSFIFGPYGYNSMDAHDIKMCAILFAGIPFGWRWASKIITAVTMKGVFIKLAIAFFLGWVAGIVVMIGDVVYLLTYLISKASKARHSASRT